MKREKCPARAVEIRISLSAESWEVAEHELSEMLDQVRARNVSALWFGGGACMGSMTVALRNVSNERNKSDAD